MKTIMEKRSKKNKKRMQEPRNNMEAMSNIIILKETILKIYENNFF